MRIRLCAAITIASVITSAPAAALNLVQNGSFETGSFSSWTRFGDTTLVRVASSQINIPTDGNFLAYFGNPDAGGISQTIGSDAGDFLISFDLSNDQGDYSEVRFGGATLASDLPDSGGNWVHYSFQASAAANPTLMFVFQNAPSYYELDSISVVRAPVPEPAAWAMLIAGFGLTGVLLRRRYRSVPGINPRSALPT